jgi:high affinity Mn2+ porin
MNWAMRSAGAYDFPADLPGYTRGAVVELNRKDFFQVPAAPNSDVLNFRTGGTVIEFEERHTIFDQPGKLRPGAFVNAGNTGNYRQALAIAAADPTLDINDVMTSIRRTNRKYGYFANLEQQLVTDLGLFARASWNDRQNEILSFRGTNEIASLGR